MASLGHYSISPRDFFNPKKGSTLTEEITCYGLPYGGLGFTSHLLTYYTIAILAEQRSPLRPWKKLTHSTFDLCVSLIGLIGGTVLAIFTLVRCRHHWQLLLISIWKLTMSVLNGAVGLHISIALKTRRKAQERVGRQRHPNREIEGSEGYWLGPVGLFAYGDGLMVGFTGLISLVVQNWSDHPKLHIITYAFSGALVLCLLCICCWTGTQTERDDGPIGIQYFLEMLGFPTLIVLLAALYSDWALGLMTNNLSGAPSGDNAALFWSYFILKRFTMLSS